MRYVAFPVCLVLSPRVDGHYSSDQSFPANSVGELNVDNVSPHRLRDAEKVGVKNLRFAIEKVA